MTAKVHEDRPSVLPQALGACSKRIVGINNVARNVDEVEDLCAHEALDIAEALNAPVGLGVKLDCDKVKQRRDDSGQELRGRNVEDLRRIVAEALVVRIGSGRDEDAWSVRVFISA